jgi:hypothetical protein
LSGIKGFFRALANILGLSLFSRKPEIRSTMAKRFPLHPKHPERVCWGCDKYCSAKDLQCGNGSGRTQHPAEMLGDDWYQWGDWGIEDAPDPTAGEIGAT